MNRCGRRAGRSGIHGPQFHLDHVFVQRRLSAYLDDELAGTDRERIDRHIGACPDCDRSARSLQRVLGALGLLRRCQPSWLTAGVLARLRSQPHRHRR